MTVSTCAPCALRPAAFFVAWNGVLCLVYTGFPPPLERLKTSLNSNAALGLKTENFGSKWPKTTLGATSDEAAPLSLENLHELKKLCEQHSARLGEMSVRSMTVRVKALTITQYTQRGLESAGRTQTTEVALEQPAAAPGEEEGPSADERARVAKVLSEWDDESSYLPHVVADGSRISTYREASPSGETLVAFLGDRYTPVLHSALAAFRAAVDEKFPGRFGWLAEESLHVTVRALS